MRNKYLLFLFGLLTGIVCTQIKYFLQKESINEYATDYNFEYEKESLSFIKRDEIRNSNILIQNKTAYWGTDSSSIFPIKELSKRKLFFYFSEYTCSSCILSIRNMLREIFTDEEINKYIVYISPDSPSRLRNKYYESPLLTFQEQRLGLPIEEKDTPFFFVLGEDLRIQYLHIHNRALPFLTNIYLQEMKKIIIQTSNI